MVKIGILFIIFVGCSTVKPLVKKQIDPIYYSADSLYMIQNLDSAICTIIRMTGDSCILDDSLARYIPQINCSVIQKDTTYSKLNIKKTLITARISYSPIASSHQLIVDASCYNCASGRGMTYKYELVFRHDSCYTKGKPTMASLWLE